MTSLTLRDDHLGLGGRLDESNDIERVLSYGDPESEYRFLRESVGLLDLSFRGRVCAIGPDRIDFIHGQVTNDVRKLSPGEGCLAALVDAKGKIQADLNIYRLKDELLLDFESGLTPRVTERLEKYIVAEDVELVDVAPHYGLLSLQGPASPDALSALNLEVSPPEKDREVAFANHPDLGEVYVIKRPRSGGCGFDLFVPNDPLAAAFTTLQAGCDQAGGGPAGWLALETTRIEAGIPRYGADMDESNLVSETGIAKQAISYSKGCYIGQEVIARIRTYGRAKRHFGMLRLAEDIDSLPEKGDLLFRGERKAGWITSAARSPKDGSNIALGYVDRDFAEPGFELELETGSGRRAVSVLSTNADEAPDRE